MAMKVQLFAKTGAVVATIELEDGVEAVFFEQTLFVLKDGVFREAKLADRIFVWDKTS